MSMTTIELLGTQHQDVLAFLAGVDADVGGPDSAAHLDALARFLDGEVAPHFQLEEQALFPLLERHLGVDGGPLAVMNAEHARFRELLAGLHEALRSGATTQQREHGSELIDLLRGHIAKEDGVLFPMAMRLLSPTELQEVEARSKQVPGSK